MYISPETKLPDYVGPKFHVTDSEAQGDTIDINDNLSAAGGDGIIKRQSPPLWLSQGFQPATGNLNKAL
jgi:hypothetical protein